MYTNLYVYKSLRLFMSGKLYWRYKKDGKWTWRPAVDVGCDDAGFICVIPMILSYEEESE